MFSDNQITKEAYIKQIDAVKALSRSLREVTYSKNNVLGKKILNLASNKKKVFSIVSKELSYRRRKKKVAKLVKPIERPLVNTTPSYFSDKRIVVYTCVFGKYDSIIEPIVFPDNVDYYIITDLDVDPNSKWKSVSITKYEKELEGLTNVEKNRWFKMHPDKVFADYEYSIYIDGNLLITTDPTEFVNKIGDVGIAMYWHRYNNCIYKEAIYNNYLVKKAPKEEIDKHIEYLRSSGMPEEFGMTTCNVIARQHFNKNCQLIMDSWWHEFMNHSKRDQLSFPYVVWKNGFKMEEIALLGNDVWETDSVMVFPH